jgi:hypothetical protein
MTTMQDEITAQLAELQRAVPKQKQDRAARLRAAEQDLKPRDSAPRATRAKPKVKRDSRLVYDEMSTD